MSSIISTSSSSGLSEVGFVPQELELLLQELELVLRELVLAAPE